MLPRLLGGRGRSDSFYLYSARAARGFGDGFAAIILPAYLSELGFNPFQIGVVAAAALLGSAVSLPPAVSDMPPVFAYHPDTQQITQRSDLVSNAPTIMGALDTGLLPALSSGPDRPTPPVGLQVVVQ